MRTDDVAKHESHNTVLVGWNTTVLTALDRVPGLRVVVVEEPELWAAPAVSHARGHFACVADVRLAEYQHGGDVVEAVSDLSAIDAVLPGAEYGVEAAATLAKRLGVPGIGTDAAATFRNKRRLRATLEGSTLAQVPYAPVDGPGDVAAFMKRVSRPVVLKPVGRQASVGVTRIEDRSDILGAWQRTTQATEPDRVASRVRSWEYLVELAVDGPEVSVEALVRGGHVIWVNVTEKTTLSTLSPVEVAHLVPGPSDGWAERIDTLVEATGAQDGLLHSEWINDGRDWNIIECAARPPGDHITDLIDLAYDFPVLHAWLDILRGTPPQVRATPGRHATIRYLVPDSDGMFVQLHGEEDARSVPGVVAVHRTMEPGRVMHDVRSSWDRIAAVIATGANATSAAAAAKEGISRLRAEFLS